MDGLLRNKTAYRTRGSQRDRPKADHRALITLITERSILYQSKLIRSIECGNMINMAKKSKMVSAPPATEASSALQTCTKQPCQEQPPSRNIWLKIRATTSWRTREANRVCSNSRISCSDNVQTFTNLYSQTRASKECSVAKIFSTSHNQLLRGRTERVL